MNLVVGLLRAKPVTHAVALRALFTYALDHPSPPEWRKPLVERKIRVDDLASELTSALVTDTIYPDIVAFAFIAAAQNHVHRISTPLLRTSKSVGMNNIAVKKRTTEKRKYVFSWPGHFDKVPKRPKSNL